ncbi:hypothetical protein [Geminocystis herdmanii]|uniref:hypothetical protein n=1 Tax=Geminocystis herdmanii TaxID=669359 RepID=UPI00034D955A|nr:hypothetical protein [Geminocystis herdmanii]
MNDSNLISEHDTDEPKIKLPEPDLDNITVLTENLPNKPILPWNRYDSDWDENVNQDNLLESEDNAENEDNQPVSDIPSKLDRDQEQVE